MSAQPQTTSVVAKVFWSFISVFASAPVAILYGVLMRYIFGLSNFGSYQAPPWLQTLSFAFLFLVPFVIGVFTVAFAPSDWRRSWVYAVLMPVFTCVLWVGVITALLWEVFICILMALPFLLPMAILGGVLTCTAFHLSGRRMQRNYAFIILAILPYLIAPIEGQFPLQDSFHTVESTIFIRAEAATVWRNMVRVSPIQESERSFRWFNFFGVPWPREAMLDKDGVGGTRYAEYEGALMKFTEPITEWQPNKTFSFEIHIVDRQKLPAPLNAIGGKAFDVKRGTFVIEPVGEGVILHLTSQHRLTTRFNSYGGWWTETLMADFQDHILNVIKQRAEAGK